MVLKDMPLIRVGYLKLSFGGTHEGTPNLIPFKTILPYMQGFKGYIIAGINLLGNIVLLIPIGFLMPFLSVNINWKRILIIAIFSGLVIESMQVILHVGIFDIDDVILNGFGVMIGYWIYLGLSMILQNKKGNLLFLITSAAIFLSLSFITISYYIQHHQLPISIGKDDETLRLPPNTQSNECCDLCGGTGGIGVITSKTDSVFDIKRKDGVTIHVTIAKKASIKSNKGNISILELRVGDHVTLVGDALENNRFLANLILVCQNK
jgi:glycopeptide antibiotics resistance protein